MRHVVRSSVTGHTQLLIVALLAAMLVGVAALPGLAQTPRDTLVIAQGLDPRSLSPLSSTAQQEKNVSNQIVERLVHFTPDGTGFVPVLATEWEMIADDTLQLKLRQGVFFTNGEPMDAHAVKYSVEQLIKAPAYGFFVSMLESAEIVDEYTINIKTKAPTPERLILTALAMGGFVYPPKYTEEVGIFDGFATAPVGTGPFMLKEWRRDDRLVLEANPNYWDGEPAIKQLVFRPIPEGAARVAALEAGDIDLSIEIPLDSWNRVSRNPNLVAVSVPGMRSFSLTFSTKWGGPVADVRIRRAMAHAIDVDGIIQFVLAGQGRRLQGQIVSDNMFGFNPDLPAVEYNPALARQLLAEAGYAGEEIIFKYPHGRYAQDKEIGEIIAAQLAEVGLRVRQQVLESGEFLTQLTSLQLRDVYYGGSLPPPDAHYMYTQYMCDFIYSYYCNEEFDRLVTEAQFTVDEEARLALYKRISEIAYDDVIGAFLFIPNDLYAYRRGVEGWEPSVDQFLYLAKVTKR